MFAYQYQFIFLVGYLAALNHNSMTWSFRDVALLFDRNGDPNRVADKHWPDKSQPVIAIGNRVGIHDARSKADPDAEDERSVRDAPSERLRPAPFLVHVVWIEVSGLAGMKDDVGFGNGAARRVSLRSHSVVFEICKVRHGLPPRASRCPLATLLFSTAGVEVFSSEQRNFTSKTKVISLALPKVGALHMGKLGTSLGWPLLMGTIILTSNVGGYIAGEWSGADRSIRSYLFSGMAIILLALGVLATAQRP